MGWFSNIFGTTESSFRIRDCILIPWYTALGMARQWNLPNESGDIPVITADGTIFAGGGSSAQNVLRWRGVPSPAPARFIVTGYDPFDSGLNGPERRFAQLEIRQSTGAYSERHVASFRYVAYTPDAIDTSAEIWTNRSSTPVLAAVFHRDYTQLGKEISLNDWATGYVHLINGAATGLRTHVVQDVDGTFAHTNDVGLDFLQGFEIRTTTTNFTVGRGRAMIQNIASASPTVFAGATYNPSRAANTTYYLYLTSAGVIERSTTAPAAAAYLGVARSMTANTSRRFIGSIRTNASGNYHVVHIAPSSGAGPSTCRFLQNAGVSNRIISGTTSPTAADVNMSAWAPPNVTIAGLFRIQNTNSMATLRYYTWDGAAFVIYSNVAGLGIVVLEVNCDTTPKIQYDEPTSLGSGGFIDLLGYTFYR